MRYGDKGPMMRIDSLWLKNYRCHADLTVEFRPGFNAIVGINGSGKTSLLGACSDVLAVLFNMLKLGDPAVVNPVTVEEVARLVVTEVHGRYRFDPHYPVAIKAKGESFGTSISWSFGRASQVAEPRTTIAPRQHAWDNPLQHRDARGLVLPVLAFYRAGRAWKHSIGSAGALEAAMRREARADGYAGWQDASSDHQALLIWTISKSLERLQAASQSGHPIEDIDDDELALVNHALTYAVEGIKGLRYDLMKKSLLVEWRPTDRPRDPTPFENLSDGQRAVIALVSDIARRMCLLNPQLGQQVTRQTDGVILIDELDVHLHPHWQRVLTKGLKRAFPAVQFIVASHSPQVLGELSPEEIILLRPEGTAHPQVSYGLDSSRVLQEIMGATARPEEVESDLSALFTALERNELDDARKTLQHLKDKAPGIPELAGAEALLERKRILGR